MFVRPFNSCSYLNLSLNSNMSYNNALNINYHKFKMFHFKKNHLIIHRMERFLILFNIFLIVLHSFENSMTVKFAVSILPSER